MKLNDAFIDFYEKVSLNAAQRKRINSAVQSLADYLAPHFGIDKQNIYVQGSFASGTSVRPLPNGEYDVDLIVLCADKDWSPAEALDELESALLQHGTYKGMVVTNPRKDSCVRLQYADEEIGGFHVDLVPARMTYAIDQVEIPKRDDGWYPSNPKAYAAWCQGQGENFIHTIKFLKRWRDHNQSVRKAIKSVTLQVIASMAFLNDETDADNLVIVMSGIANMLRDFEDSPPPIPNPVLPDEDFGERWDLAHYKDFRLQAMAAAELAEQAFTEEDPEKSALLWQELLGFDFPGPTEARATHLRVPELGDYSHRLPVPWSHNPSNSRVVIEATKRMQPPKKNGFRPGWEGPPSTLQSNEIIEPNRNLYFKAITEVLEPYSVQWQIVNTGEHALKVDGLRGGFESCNYQDKNVRKESSLYLGTHWIEAFIIQDRSWVARSGPFLVKIRS